ncbi:MAG: hypothetical protein D6769_02510 [Methanobacteriota archaeon]|nr:MAG: hypothetical protein D6769_02510 [Euryarchaeota archaeon]
MKKMLRQLNPWKRKKIHGEPIVDTMRSFKGHFNEVEYMVFELLEIHVKDDVRMFAACLDNFNYDEGRHYHQHILDAALYLAVMHKSLEAVKVALEKNANPRGKSPHGELIVELARKVDSGISKHIEDFLSRDKKTYHYRWLR